MKANETAVEAGYCGMRVAAARAGRDRRGMDGLSFPGYAFISFSVCLLSGKDFDGLPGVPLVEDRRVAL